MKHIVFDCETSPLPAEEIRQFMPEFDAPANYKDADKIAAYIAAKQAEWLDRAALSAMTGRILCIGLLDTGGEMTVLDGGGSEWQLLTDAWQRWLDYTIGDFWVGHNCLAFDLPYMVRRSRILGVTVPHKVREGRNWHPRFKDTMEAWQMGNREDRISLDNLARVLGVGEKSGSGKDFAGLWQSDKTKAMAYIKNEIELTMRCAEKMRMLA